MERIFRFMSYREFFYLTKGRKIFDRKKWQKCKTTSQGVCFMPCNNNESFIATYEILAGIVSSDMAVLFSLTEKGLKRIKKSKGQYANILSDDWEETILEDELYFPNYYNLEDVSIEGIYINDEYNNKKEIIKRSLTTDSLSKTHLNKGKFTKDEIDDIEDQIEEAIMGRLNIPSYDIYIGDFYDFKMFDLFD